ncbi:S8 family serine peptidase [Pedobacter sp. FW305-3-2-15-E-R2A2]|uniref:S8 family peptidase n=1 Tax=Pedobacter sp. FW305-3-2-15-E-R2A2 TaxID=3140251 RepID=UPI0031401CB8
MKPLNQLLNPEFPRYFYYQGSRVYLNNVQNKVLISFREPTSLESKKEVLSRINKTFGEDVLSTVEGNRIEDKFLILDLHNSTNAKLADGVQIQFDQPEIEYISAVYTTEDSPKVLMALTNQLFVGVKPKYSIEDLDALLDKFGGISKKEQFGDNVFLLTLADNEKFDSLDIANQISESPLIEYAEPSFFRSMPVLAYTPNDPLYSSEWHIPRIGADNVWCWGNAGSSVSIGIMDVGINTSHPDLSAFFLGTYDPTGLSLGYDAHGTLCAGAALENGDNSIGGCGVAYMARLYQIRIGYNPTTDPNSVNMYSLDAWLVGGLNYAYSNGIAVLSCSFSLGAPSTTFNNRLTNLADSGRGGYGTVVVAATGNEGVDGIAYPASHAKVISVGSSNYWDEKSIFSNYGWNMSLIAPGENITTTTYLGGYTNSFNGTSAATPIVAGAVALILHDNVFLSRTQVTEELLINCCDKVGQYDYYVSTYGMRSYQTGFGRLKINKYYTNKYKINGPDFFCGSQQQYTMPVLPPIYTKVWSSSNPNLPVDSTGLMTNPHNVNERTILTVTLVGGACDIEITKNVAVGVCIEEFYAIGDGPRRITLGNNPSEVVYVRNNSALFWPEFPYAGMSFGYAPRVGETTLDRPNNSSLIANTPFSWMGDFDMVVLEVISHPPTWTLAYPFPDYKNGIMAITAGNASGTLVVKLSSPCGFAILTFNVVGID